ncbi:Uncharacterised protein [Mycobacteroides abscessus]|nr:Uncharacterised protein [Mycobacteroides abscessus]
MLIGCIGNDRMGELIGNIFHIFFIEIDSNHIMFQADQLSRHCCTEAAQPNDCK